MKTIFAPLKRSEYDGIPDMAFALPRLDLLMKLFDMITKGNSRFIHIASPPATGKTSLLQLFKLFCEKRGITCIYVSMLLADFNGEMRDKTGINSENWMLESTHNICTDPSKQYVVMLDDAQNNYSDIKLWTSLIKPNSQLNLPNNIRFIISATYPLSTYPAYQGFLHFNNLPKLVRKDFCLCQDEAKEFIRLSCERKKTEIAGQLLINPVICHLITTYCNGHIGAISMSVIEIVKHFYQNTTVTIEDIVNFYLSNTMSRWFLRCYSCIIRTVPKSMQTELLHCLTSAIVSVSHNESTEVYSKLIMCGVLEELVQGQIQFTTPAAASYINHLRPVFSYSGPLTRHRKG